MLDSTMRPLIDRPLNGMGRRLAAYGVGADEVTLLGLGFGLVAALILALGLSGWLVLLPLFLNRLADGLDGAVARATGKTDFGGYLDLLCDFAFYGAIPLAFLFRDVDQNAWAAGFLLFCFYVNGASFLGYAALAAKAGMETQAQGEKSIYYAAGLMEGTETILFFTLFALFPSYFPVLAVLFGLLCLVTTLARLALARQVFD